MKHICWIFVVGCLLSGHGALAPLPKARLPDAAKLQMNAGREIPFAHPLPRMHCGKNTCGTYNNMELSLPGVLTTQDPRLGLFMQKLRETIFATRRMLFVDGKCIVCCHNWIRDHVQQMKGWKHWEYRPADFLNFIIDTQRADGQFYELVKQMDDYHWSFVGPESRILYPEDNMSLVRLELEADVEYLVVEGAWQYYRMTGDNTWLARTLPALEKGINYQTSDCWRWEPALGLCIRPYTIDTWDFTFDSTSDYDRRVANKPLCAMHGDNTGVYQAMNQLAWFNERLGRTAQAAALRGRAATLRANIMKHLWNGRFFVHQLPVRGAVAVDAHERERLSLSDAYALNRGILTVEDCRAVVEAFRSRGQTAGTCAEFFTIDPPYAPLFGRYPPGDYVNGAISPFTAGELAKGAFRCGYEAYGWDIIRRWVDKLEKDGNIYFLYDRVTGGPKSVTAGPSAWGAAALMDAVEEGLAGVVDADVRYQKLEFAPRWAVTPYTEGRYVTGYELNRDVVDYRWIFTEKGFRYRLTSPAREVRAHLLVPNKRQPMKLLIDGQNTSFKLTDVFGSTYIDVTAHPTTRNIDFEVVYAPTE